MHMAAHAAAAARPHLAHILLTQPSPDSNRAGKMNAKNELSYVLFILIPLLGAAAYANLTA